MLLAHLHKGIGDDSRREVVFLFRKKKMIKIDVKI